MLRTFSRKTQWLGLALVAALLIPGCVCVPGTDFVYIRDTALESAIRASIHKPFGCLLEQDLAQARSIEAYGLGITSLDGLEFCTNLTSLDLRGNSIKSIEALTNLSNLVTLDLSNNQITRIDALAGLFLLRNVDLAGEDNDIRDFSPLSANALNGGLGDGAVVTLGKEWTLDDEGNLFPDVADDVDILTSQGVTVLFALATQGSGSAK